MDKINVGVYGGRGYAGRVLCKLLEKHGQVGGSNIVAASKGNEDFEIANPNMRGSGIKYVSPDELEARADKLDIVFLRGEGGESLRQAPLFLEKGAKVIDLGGDFRLSRENYEKTYGRQHTATQLLEEAVYGIPELVGRDKISKARLVANPGCYVITGLLGLYPLLKERMIETDYLPIFAANGTTGGKSEPTKGLMHADVSGNITAYNLDGHRHAPEFDEKIGMLAGQPSLVNFNVDMGDFKTGIYLRAAPKLKPRHREVSRENLLDIFKRHYVGEPFVRINDRLGGGEGAAPKESAKDYSLGALMSSVRGSNFCDIGLHVDKRIGVVRVVVATDNLVKGAAGNAIQNMNLMFSFDETEGLREYASL